MSALGLRARLVIAFAVVSVLSGAAVAGASYLQVRDLALTAAQDDLVERVRADTTKLVAPDHAPSQLELSDLAFAYNGLVMFGTMHGQIELLRPQDVPSELRQAVRSRKNLQLQRVERDGRLYVIVGSVLKSQDGRDTGIEVYRELHLVVQQDIIGQLPGSATTVIGISLLPAVLLALIAARSVLRPVRTLRSGARRVTSGELDTRLAASGSDELADLVRAFNTMTAELERTMADLRRAEENSRRFVADVSHELRTPLTAMTAMTEVLDDEVSTMTGDLATATAMVSAETRKLRRLAEDLIEISRFDANVAVLRCEPVDLAALVPATLAARGWTDLVEMDIPDTLEVDVDRRRVDVVVANLVGNALKHGARPVRVELRSSGSQVVITVTDSGPGLVAGVIPHVFERFYKADSARKRSEGSGLGLAIAWENTRLHGGSLDAANAPAGGARFTVRLPGSSA